MKSYRVEAMDSMGGSPEHDARLLMELEEHLPLLIQMIGIRAFHAVCQQLWEIAGKAPEGAMMVEKNTAGDGAFLYVGTHSFDVVAALRKELGMEGRADKELPAVAQKIRNHRKREGN